LDRVACECFPGFGLYGRGHLQDRGSEWHVL